MRHYNMDNGLPQNSIKDIVKDKYGFIWLSTEGSVIRWDGDNFTVYNQFRLKDLSFGDFYGDITKDSIKIYTNSFEEGLSITKRNPNPLVISKEKSHPLFFTKGNRYEQFVKNSLTTKFFKFVTSYFIQLQHGTYNFDNNIVKYTDHKTGKTVIINIKFPHAMLKKAFVHQERIFITDTTNKRLYELYEGKLSTLKAPSIYTDPKSNIYWQQTTDQAFVINSGKIYLSTFDGRELTAKFLLKYEDIDKDASGAIFYDKEFNKLYIGSAINGLKILDISNFYVSKKNIPYEDENCYAALPFSKNSIITQQGIEYFKDKTRKAYSARLTYEKRYLLYDDSGNLIYRDNNSIQKRYKISQFNQYDSISFGTKKVEGIYKSGGLYMAAVSYNKQWNLYVFDNDRFKNIDKAFHFNSNINSVLRYNNDLLYVGCTNGIYIVTLTKNKIVKNLAKDLPVKEIIRTKDRNIWFTTYNRGIYLLLGEKVIKLPSDKNNYISNAHTIREDKQSNFWISTNNGLFKVSKRSLLGYVKNGNIVTYYHYTKTDGFLNNEFNGSAIPSSNVLADGQFVFPSIEGFVFFKPEETKTYFPLFSQVIVERAKINNKSIILFKNKLNLKKGYTTADIFIDVPYYFNFENIYLQAKLENSEYSNWINIKKDRKFTISNVKPGEYTMIFRFLTKNGKFAYKKIPVKIQAYFYQTLVFKIILFFLLVLIILIIVQIRTNFLRFRNKDLQRELSIKNKELEETATTLQKTKDQLHGESEYQKQMISAITHDLTTPVKFISMISKKLVQTEDSEIQKMCFDSIHKSSEELYKFTLGLKEYSEFYKQENVNEDDYQLFDIIESKKLLFEEMALQKNIRIFNVCDSNLKVRINKNIISAIFHNIIDNAVKYTQQGEIIISITVHDFSIEVSIADTGNGMSDEKMQYYNELFRRSEIENSAFKNYGLGLHMVNQLIKKTDLEIFFKNNQPKGTICVITIKKEDDKTNIDR